MLKNVIATVVIAATSGAACAAVTAPGIGSVETYACEGPYSTNVTRTVISVNGGVVRYEGTADDRITWSEKPLWAIPTTYAPRRSRGDDKGVREMQLRKGELDGLAALQPGSSFKARIREEHDKAGFTWRYSVEVGDRSSVSHPALGRVEMVEIRESRTTGSYSSTMTVRFAPALGVTLGWQYDDQSGSQRCSLVSQS